MLFGICIKFLKDDLIKYFLIFVEILDKFCIEVMLLKDVIGLECLESVMKEFGLYEVSFSFRFIFLWWFCCG